MFYVKAGSQSVLYTGDYNMTPDRHLGAAWADRCKPDLFITETTLRYSFFFGLVFSCPLPLIHSASSS